MSDAVTLFADFNNRDRLGRVRLNCRGTVEDLARLGVRLRPGLRVTLDDGGGLTAAGRVVRTAEGVWAAELEGVDW